MKLELKHLAPYLPYGLKCIYPDKENEILILVGLNSPYKTVDKCFVTCNLRKEKTTRVRSHVFNVENPEVNFKPILRPLSDLIKVIKHNGESFIPFVALAILEYGENLEGVEIPEIENEYGIISLELNPSWFSLMYHTVRGVFTRWDDGEGNSGCLRELNDKLFEWHFDVFGLIPAGLAIDKNTLK